MEAALILTPEKLGIFRAKNANVSSYETIIDQERHFIPATSLVFVP